MDSELYDAFVDNVEELNTRISTETELRKGIAVLIAGARVLQMCRATHGTKDGQGCKGCAYEGQNPHMSECDECSRQHRSDNYTPAATTTEGDTGSAPEKETVDP